MSKFLTFLFWTLIIIGMMCMSSEINKKRNMGFDHAPFSEYSNY